MHTPQLTDDQIAGFFRWVGYILLLRAFIGYLSSDLSQFFDWMNRGIFPFLRQNNQVFLANCSNCNGHFSCDIDFQYESPISWWIS
jgi:hypothetical protein